MTVPRLIEISDYWSTVPPLQEAFAAFVGALGGTSKTATPDTNDDAALMKDLMAAGFQIPDGILD